MKQRKKKETIESVSKGKNAERGTSTKNVITLSDYEY